MRLAKKKWRKTMQEREIEDRKEKKAFFLLEIERQENISIIILLPTHI